MYKILIQNGVASEKSMGCYLGENEYEITVTQFMAAEIPCEASVANGVVTLGDAVDYTRVTRQVEEAPALTEADVRAHRDRLLTETDYTQMGDSALTDESKAAFAVYRQSLRDITTQENFPENVSWPEMPDAVNSATT